MARSKVLTVLHKGNTHLQSGHTEVEQKLLKDLFSSTFPEGWDNLLVKDASGNVYAIEMHPIVYKVSDEYTKETAKRLKVCPKHFKGECAMCTKKSGKVAAKLTGLAKARQVLAEKRAARKTQELASKTAKKSNGHKPVNTDSKSKQLAAHL